ncbi:MAG: winged helix-turn-helix transcriptional regulator [Candidatus Helarchaeota archaeon]|nr:winged helix-turn-helix transcriptional regulator [Candidatus Helarchaeota archaeon]
MHGIKINAKVALTLVVIFAFLIWNVIYVGIAFLGNINEPNRSESSDLAIIYQNQDLMLNDMQTSSIEGTKLSGVLIITQNQIKITETLVLSSFFIYFIIATNVQDFNLFPSQVKLNQSTRQKIFEIIEQNEGIHLREICRAMDKKMGVVQYHIYVMESANLISSMKDGRYKRFFVNHKNSLEERLVICLLQRETTGKILNLIFEKNGQGISHSTIAKEMGTSSQAITWHIHKLTDADIISTTKKGCQKFYQINPNFLPILESLL